MKISFLIFGIFFSINVSAEELLIDHDCQPESFLTRAKFSLMSEKELKSFWAKQARAVEADYKRYMQSNEIRNLSRRQDREKQNLERQHHEQMMNSLNIKRDPKLEELMNSSEGKVGDVDNFIEEGYARMDVKKLEWAKKCWAYATERSK
ncbi:MAG: hypothetical protein AB1516_11870 [Pseudomonadota bacterium]